MMAGPYISTRTLQAAVKDRETEVLDALKIAWQDGAGHITCPYSDHADEQPSWRWEQAKARAYCTCIEWGGHSIFDVVMRLESLDFEATKLRIAEILGRHDLIETKDGRCMNAASLIRPPAEQRDDRLPRNYLGHRLGVPPEEVVMPSTATAGWRALPYYDRR